MSYIAESSESQATYTVPVDQVCLGTMCETSLDAIFFIPIIFWYASWRSSIRSCGVNGTDASVKSEVVVDQTSDLPIPTYTEDPAISSLKFSALTTLKGVLTIAVIFYPWLIFVFTLYLFISLS